MESLPRLFRRNAERSGSIRQDGPLPYSWILTQQLAIGPMPRTQGHWDQLELAGFRRRFSCCYPEEDLQAKVPEQWHSGGVALPDHRNQEPMSPDRLMEALDQAQAMVNSGAPVYLHCLAGVERSSLMAVGLTARLRQIDLFSALDWVRRCHPMAKPIYEHLDVLEQVLKR